MIDIHVGDLVELCSESGGVTEIHRGVVTATSPEESVIYLGEHQVLFYTGSTGWDVTVCARADPRYRCIGTSTGTHPEFSSVDTTRTDPGTGTPVPLAVAGDHVQATTRVDVLNTAAIASARVQDLHAQLSTAWELLNQSCGPMHLPVQDARRWYAQVESLSQDIHSDVHSTEPPQPAVNGCLVYATWKDDSDTEVWQLVNGVWSVLGGPANGQTRYMEDALLESIEILGVPKGVRT